MWIPLVASLLALGPCQELAPANPQASVAPADVIAQMRALYQAHRNAGQTSETRANLLDFWERNDPVHGAEAPYLLEKSMLLGWIDEDEESERVFDLVPDEALVEPLELLRRLRSRMASVRADVERVLPLAVRLAAADGTRFEAWLHDSYAQGFAPRLKPWVDLAAEREFLRRLSEASPVAARSAMGLSAWLAVLGNETVALDPLAKLGPSLDEDAARAERYRLLLLEAALGRPELEERALAELAATAQRLEARSNELHASGGEAVDAALRARIDYYLAHAAFLIATRASSLDANARTGWFRKCAAWDPVLRGCKPVDCVYEAVCLGGPKEYSRACLAELERLGRNEAAVELWIELACQVPERFLDARAEVVRLGGTAFDARWLENIERSWSAAPELTLTAIDGTSRPLLELRGGWILIDFWGTWCGPCRAQLPAVNALHRELAADPERRGQVITVACQDTRDAVERFLAESGHSFSVVVDDGSLQRAFAVTQWPTRLLVSPSGRYRKLRVEEPGWEAVVRAILLGPPADMR